MPQLQQPEPQPQRTGADPLVTVCGACLRASCWQTRFVCDAFRRAGTKRLRASALHRLALESPSFWRAP